MKGRDKVACWRVTPPFPFEPFFIYTAKEMLHYKKDKNSKLQGPFLQWEWIRDHQLTPNDLKDFEYWYVQKIGPKTGRFKMVDEATRRRYLVEWVQEVKQAA